ncbi:hypothetical protein Pfo_012999 [Paulownia fortunei]|nr:hypothetical protein Pfo_012999 [Paulownia fortunei]
MATQKKQNHIVSQCQPPHKRAKTLHMADDIVETIISYLPVKDVSRLAILSRRFRYSWKFCRDLSFDNNFAKNLSRNEFKNIVNNFFHSHLNSSADKFRLYFDATGETSLVSYWIQMAVRLGIKEIELDLIPSKKKFMLNYDLVNVESIKIMRLVNCELHLPFNSNGLCHLRELTFQNVRARPIAIQAIFANCLALRSLQLIHCNFIFTLNICAQDLIGFKMLVVKDCSDVHSININAPTLYSFHYHGKLCAFKFQNDLPHLNDVIIDITYSRGFQLLPHRNDMVISLAFVRTLTVSSTFVEGLSTRFEEYEYREMEFYLWKLKEFHLLVAPESYLNSSDIATFLKKCPSVERVFVDLGQNAFGNSLYWDLHGRKYLSECHTLFPFLKCVKVKGFTLKEQPVTMGRFFLKNAINLHDLILVKAKNYNYPEIFTPDCLRSDISSNANIEIYDYKRDKSVINPEHLNGV